MVGEDTIHSMGQWTCMQYSNTTIVASDSILTVPQRYQRRSQVREFVKFVRHAGPKQP